MFDWIKSLWGTIIKDGELAKQMQRIPCVVHEGESFRPGTPVNFGLKVFVVKHVFISNDLMKCSLMVTNAANEHDNSKITEEIMLNLEEVIPMQNWELSETMQALSKSVASNSYSELFEDIPYYPLHIKRAVRKHMLISKLRRTIHYFLTGLEMVGNFNLGLIDWEHDPHFLKHSILVYKIEDSKHEGEDNDLDVLLGPKWDIVDMSITMDSFRIVLTMEIKINSNGELCVTGHAATCALVPDTNGCAYRAQYLRYSSECHSEVSESCNRVGALSQNSEVKPEDGRESGAENRTSLIWDSFNAQKDPDIFSTPIVQEDVTTSSAEENSILSTHAQAVIEGVKTISECYSELSKSYNHIGDIKQNSEMKPEDVIESVTENETSLILDSFNVSQKDPDLFSTPTVQEENASKSHSDVSKSFNNEGVLSQNSEIKPKDGTENTTENKTSHILDSFDVQKDPDLFSTPTVQEENASKSHSDVSELYNNEGVLSQKSEMKPKDGTESTTENETSHIWDSFDVQKDPDMFSTQEDVTTSGDNSGEDSILSPLAQAVGEVSKTMSESGNSSLNHSRISQSTASTRPRLQGLFQTGPLINNQRVKKNSDPQLQQTCPFPNEWQFGTVPEVIANDEDID